jgi:hypothetical protein
MLTLAEVHGWHSGQIDFVLAFPWAKVKTNMYMQVPKNFCVDANNTLIFDKNAPHPSWQ